MDKLKKGKVIIEWVELGEGWSGDYNSDDPEDEELLRFDAYIETTSGKTTIRLILIVQGFPQARRQNNARRVWNILCLICMNLCQRMNGVEAKQNVCLGLI